MGRPSRKVPQRNYVDLHFGRHKKSPKEESDTDHDSDEVSIPSGEGSDFNTTEEGEITDSAKEDSEDELEGSKLDVAIKKAFSEEDFDQPDKLLTLKEKRCEELKQEIAKEERTKEQAERWRRRRMMEERFRRLREKEDKLNKSLASSRSSTP